MNKTPKPNKTGVPCYALWIDRGRATLYQKARYTGNQGIIKAGFRKTLDFYINDDQVPIDLKAIKGIPKLLGLGKPLFIIDAKTGVALEYQELAEQEKDELGKPKMEKGEWQTTEKKPDGTRVPVSKPCESPAYVRKRGTIALFPRAEPTIHFKLGVFSKTSFWEMLAAMMHVKLMTVLIYMAAGGGVTLALLDVVSVIFLKKHLFA